MLLEGPCAQLAIHVQLSLYCCQLVQSWCGLIPVACWLGKMIQHKPAWSLPLSLPRWFTLRLYLSMQIYPIAPWGSFPILPLSSAFGALHLTAISNCKCRMLSLRAGHQMRFDLFAVSGNRDNAINRSSVKSKCARRVHYSQQYRCHAALIPT